MLPCHWSSGAVTQSPTPGASLWGARFRQGPAARGLDQGASQCASLLLRAKGSVGREASMHQALELWGSDPESNPRCVAVGRPVPARPSSQRPGPGGFPVCKPAP